MTVVIVKNQTTMSHGSYTRCFGKMFIQQSCNACRWYAGLAIYVVLFVMGLVGTLVALLPETNCDTSVGGTGC